MEEVSGYSGRDKKSVDFFENVEQYISNLNFESDDIEVDDMATMDEKINSV